MRAGSRVLITDLKTKKELAQSIAVIEKETKKNKLPAPQWILGKHRAADFISANLVIRNPAVPHNSPLLERARKRNIPVHTDVSFFFSLLKSRAAILPQPLTIGVTGTKGKSTTAALLYHVLQDCRKKTLLAGNIRKSPLDYVTNDHVQSINSEYLVLELSSFHLESLNEHKLSPNAAIITNILPDHLNRYKNFNEYVKTKTCIFKHQKRGDIVFLNKDDAMSRKIGKQHEYGKTSKVIWFQNSSRSHTGLIHGDNLSAVQAVSEYIGLNKKDVRSAIKSFKGLEGRLEPVARIGGIDYYNDTCATQAEATIFGISQIAKKQNVILIAGGSDKNLSYESLAATIKRQCKYAIIYKGVPADTASDKLVAALEAVGYRNFCIKNSLAQCAHAARARAKKGDAVLFSPAASSFGKFQHEFDRGEQFKKAVRRILK
jgi:UDP-N-acetylmuramoylalanine--D-glutamate ligase